MARTVMRIATWNINSIRLRQDLVDRVITLWQPDVLCLQETKCPDALFPERRFRDQGYGHIALAGQKGYNGVAILSRLPLSDVTRQTWCGQADCRHLRVTVTGTAGQPIQLHNFYVPAGGDVPDPEQNPKFAHKLQFLEEMAAHWASAGGAADQPTIVVGDLNVAPLETDVWSHKQMLGVVSHTPAEVTRLDQILAASGLKDAVRHHVPAQDRLYSWWSYRARDWAQSDRGRRLDHIWATPALVHTSLKQETLRDARGWEPKPSDHVPVMVEFDPGR